MPFDAEMETTVPSLLTKIPGPADPSVDDDDDDDDDDCFCNPVKVTTTLLLPLAVTVRSSK